MTDIILMLKTYADTVKDIWKVGDDDFFEGVAAYYVFLITGQLESQTRFLMTKKCLVNAIFLFFIILNLLL